MHQVNRRILSAVIVWIAVLPAAFGQDATAPSTTPPAAIAPDTSNPSPGPSTQSSIGHYVPGHWVPGHFSKTHLINGHMRKNGTYVEPKEVTGSYKEGHYIQGHFTKPRRKRY